MSGVPIFSRAFLSRIARALGGKLEAPRSNAGTKSSAGTKKRKTGPRRPSSKAARRWWVVLFNYPEGDPDRRVKGSAGPFVTEAEASAAADAEKDVWYPVVVHRRGNPA